MLDSLWKKWKGLNDIDQEYYNGSENWADEKPRLFNEGPNKALCNEVMENANSIGDSIRKDTFPQMTIVWVKE